MKRSEMLKLLRKELLRPSDEEIEMLLSTFEKLGMAPPMYISLPDVYNRSEGTYGFEVYRWEDED